MPDRKTLELAARLVAALHAATRGRPGRFRRVDDCAQRAGISAATDVDRAVETGEAAGFLVARIEAGQREAMIAETGLAAART